MDDEAVWNTIYLTIALVVMLHIRKQARQIGEPWLHLLIPTLFFWWAVYPLWLFVWPGMCRLSRIGKDPECYLPVTKNRKRLGVLKSDS